MIAVNRNVGVCQIASAVAGCHQFFAYPGLALKKLYLHPGIFRRRNRRRQETILYQMLDQQLITQEEYDEAVAQEMVFKDGVSFEAIALLLFF